MIKKKTIKNKLTKKSKKVLTKKGPAKKKEKLEWEIIEKNNLYYIYLKKKYWKFKDKPVCYVVSITKIAAEEALERLNNPIYDEEL